MSEGATDVVVIVPYRDPTFGTMTFAVCTVEDLVQHLSDDDPEPDDLYESGIVGAIQRAAIDGPFSSGTPKPEETFNRLEKAATSNSTEGSFTYWDKIE
jgi:hypothetical protein